MKRKAVRSGELYARLTKNWKNLPGILYIIELNQENDVEYPSIIYHGKRGTYNVKS